MIIFLEPCCKAINRFFEKTWGIPETPIVEELFNRITNFGFGSPQDTQERDFYNFVTHTGIHVVNYSHIFNENFLYFPLIVENFRKSPFL